MLDAVKTHLKPGGYTHDDLKKALGVEEIMDLINDIPNALGVLEHNAKFMIFE